jgi:hypothetical protein
MSHASFCVKAARFGSSNQGEAASAGLTRMRFCEYAFVLTRVNVFDMTLTRALRLQERREKEQEEARQAERRRR